MTAAEVLTLGIDVGGTKIAAGVVDAQGRILSRTRRSTPARDPEALRTALTEVVGDLRAEHDVAAVGLSAAGFVSRDRRRVLLAPNMDFGDTPLAGVVEEATGLPVVVENDGNAAAWAEYRFGAGRGVPDQLMVALGTGVGGGLVLDGRLYRGGHGTAAEIGHVGLVPDGLPCGCGRRGCLEQYASGTALDRDARDAARRGDAPGLLAAAHGDPDAVTGRLVTEAAGDGSVEARALLDRLAGFLGRGVASVVAVLDPSLVVLGGGLGAVGDLVRVPTAAALEAQLPGEHRPRPDVVTAALGNDAGLIGAADLAREAHVQH